MNTLLALCAIFAFAFNLGVLAWGLLFWGWWNQPERVVFQLVAIVLGLVGAAILQLCGVGL